MKKITVLIVDDSALIRKIYTELLSDAYDIEVLGTAVDAQDARTKIKSLNPDVITLDVEMPGMDGISFLEKIMTLRPMPVIMASTLTQKGAEITIRALELGAVDYISKPTGAQTRNALMGLKEELLRKIRAAATANIGPRSRTTHEHRVLNFRPCESAPKLIAIGASTGGVEALRDIFQQLPGNLPPIVIVQHMPEAFTASFAARLNALSEVEVAEAEQGMTLQAGHAYLAHGGKHLSVVRQGREWACQVEAGPAVSGHCPSVDVLFHSVAEVAGSNAVGILLTGMGKDGASGLLKMRDRGAYTMGQSAQSCVVYGMPKAARALGAVRVELPLSDIPHHLLAHLEREGKEHHAV